MNIIILNNRACLGLVSDLVRILNPVFGMCIQNRIVSGLLACCALVVRNKVGCFPIGHACGHKQSGVCCSLPRVCEM